MNKEKVISRSPLQDRATKEKQNNDPKVQQNVVDEIVIKKVINKIGNKPRLAFWNLECALALHYLKETQPNFSMSAETARLMKKAVKEEYPDIWKAVINQLSKQK
jgi:hypothetical protein